jgi:hypothetical protein
VPHELTAALAALAVEASPGDFAAAERLLAGHFRGSPTSGATRRQDRCRRADPPRGQRSAFKASDRTGCRASRGLDCRAARCPDELRNVCGECRRSLVPCYGRYCLRAVFRWSAPGPRSRSRRTHHALQTGSITGGATPRGGSLDGGFLVLLTLVRDGRPCAMPAARSADQRTLQTAGRRDGLGRADRAGASRVRPPGARGHRLPVGCHRRRIQGPGPTRPLRWSASLGSKSPLPLDAAQPFSLCSRNGVRVPEFRPDQRSALWCSRSRMARTSLHAMGLPGPGTSGRHLHRLTTGGAF